MDLEKAVGIINKGLRSLALNADDRDLVNEAFETVLASLREGIALKARAEQVVSTEETSDVGQS